CAGDAEIGNVDYVRMSKQPDRLRLSSEPFDEFTVTGQLRRNDFDGYATACAHVSSAINRAHSASAAKVFDFILPIEQLANHSIRFGRGLPIRHLERIDDLLLPFAELLGEAGFERRRLHKTVVPLMRCEQRL